MNSAAHKQKATFIGFIAILLWSTLALLTSLNGEIPPFQLLAMTFFIAFLGGAFYFIKKKGCLKSLKHLCLSQPLTVWINGILGLFGYHILYFISLRNAPVIEASLIGYLWPVLIVLFSSFLPGERLKWFHLVGVLLGFLGLIILLKKTGFVSLDQKYLSGYFFALSCAVIWATYSVISKKHKSVPTVLIGAFCGITALISMICHLLFEETFIPQQWRQWVFILLLGAGPLGFAFYVWDYGMKNGNIKLLGTLSYVAPLLSSSLLILFGKTSFSIQLLIACAFITAGSLISSLENWIKKNKRS